MKYLLDTNACIQSIRKRGSILVKRRLGVQLPSDIVVCSVVVGELCYGAAKSQNPATEHARVDAFLAPYRSLPFDDAVARRYAELRALLESQGRPIADLDLIIAATALVHGLTLVTHNTSDFARVPGLILEDWEIP